MPYAKDISSYPESFELLFEKALEETFTIKCKSVAERTNLVFQLHAYRRLVKDLGLPNYNRIAKVIIRKTNKFTIEFESKDRMLDNILENSGIDLSDLEQFKREPTEAEFNQFADEVDIFQQLTEKGNEQGHTELEPAVPQDDEGSGNLSNKQEETDSEDKA